MKDLKQFFKNKKIGERKMKESELKLIKLGRKFLRAEDSDSEILEQMKLLIDFALCLQEIDLNHGKQVSEAA